MAEKIKCKQCRHWHKDQSNFGYREDYGVCDMLNDEEIAIVPHEELYLNLDYKFANDNQSIKSQEYDIFTGQDFGCVKGEKKK